MEAQTQFSTSWHANMSLTFDEPIWNVPHCNLHTTSQAYTKNFQTWKVLELSVKARKQGYNRGFDPSLRKCSIKSSLVGGKSKPTPKVG